MYTPISELNPIVTRASDHKKAVALKQRFDHANDETEILKIILTHSRVYLSSFERKN